VRRNSGDFTVKWLSNIPVFLSMVLPVGFSLVQGVAIAAQVSAAPHTNIGVYLKVMAGRL
jgi:hypothetical protein